ncbi:hypothetical protein BKA70DRAFT_409301 [Coprinopsis sp. MPI-PUGE-AT-0042]|nr:hypothetical protein BKA70DRAFT_409301 [Coprinopsis sp. MPI-PUGE-AT-0042]
MTDIRDRYESTRRNGLGEQQETRPGTIENLRLNYAFIDPPGEIPSPLPLAIPRALLNAPTADLRSIIREKLEAEEVILRLREIRFWRTRQPLQISHALVDRDMWIQREGVENRFEAIPFTESLFSSLGEWIWDEKLLHLIVTGGQAPFIIELATPDPSAFTMQIPASQYIAIGSYSVCLKQESWKYAKEGDRLGHDISIPWQASSSPSGSPASLQNTLAQTPTALLGIKTLDTGSRGNEIQLLSYVSDVHSDSFRGHFDSFGRTILYSACLSWMAITPYHHRSGDGIQCGTTDSQSSQTPRKLGQRSTQKRVLFRQAYERTPNVFSCLAGLNIGGPGSTHWDIRSFVTNIDREGFTVHIEKTRNSEQDVNEVVANAQTSWVAFPSGRTASQSMACGEFHLGEGVRTEEGESRTPRWRGRVSFSETFTSPPQVFVAFTSFDVDKSTNVRLGLSIENVSREGMEWKVGAWGGTVVYSATIAYLAVGAL